jgi:CRP-like cAMP-binding protein
VALLRTDAIFSPLVLAAVDQLASATTVESYAPGERILVEGDVGDRYHVIESGRVEVVRGGVVIDEMRAGDGFGEVALLDGAPRNATIVARTPTTTRSLDGRSFVAALRADDRSRTAAERVADERRPQDPTSAP